MWNKLSMKEKAALIKVAVSNGLTDLDLIKNKYNEFADGGNVNKYNLGGPSRWDRLDDLAEKYEPHAAALGLAGTTAAVGMGMTGVGAPAAPFVAGIANAPSAIIDGYQAIRNWNKVAKNKEDASVSDALWNTGEFALDVAGGKIFSLLGKGVSDYKVGKEISEKITEEVRRRSTPENIRFLMRKNNFTPEQARIYITEKATNAAANSADIIRDEKSTRAKNDKRAKDIYTGVNQIPNVIDLVNGVQLPEIIVTPEGGFIPGYTYLNQPKALGGPLLNQNNPIESFNGGRRLPIVRYDEGGYLSVL